MGMYLERSSRLPVHIMDKLYTSLRWYLNNHSMDECPLHLMVTILHQLAQAHAYHHSYSPHPSSQKALLNVVPFVTKISDFGHEASFCLICFESKVLVKGTLVHNMRCYTDVFSFGNIILFTETNPVARFWSPKSTWRHLVALSVLHYH